MKSWIEDLPLPRTLDLLTRLARVHAAHAGPFYGPQIQKLITNSDWVGLVTYELDYSRLDTDPLQFMEARQALGYFQKLEHLEIGADKEAVAYDKFIQAEQSCGEINHMFRMMRAGRFSPDLGAWTVITTAKRKIAHILGKCPKIGDLTLKFGPGASTSIKRRDSHPSSKMAKGFQCSYDLYSSGRLPELLRELPHWLSAFERDLHETEDGYEATFVDVDLHPGRLEFVPKNAKTYRSIVVEPTLNGLLQAGIGKVMAARLRRAGIDISDQSRNAMLARKGSLLGDNPDGIATVDLSSASDTISTELVRFLLPPDWYALLACARSSTVSYRGVEMGQQKFSSMGNGFTFPLETLIFWSLAQSACVHSHLKGFEEDLGVYGDDIALPTRAYDRLAKALQFCGFSLNKEKSFTTGPFRESCGHDYYKGIDIRPYYQKDLVSVRTLYVLHNYFRRLYGSGNSYSDGVRSFIPRHLRLYGPDGYGDGHLISDEWPSTIKTAHRAKGYGGSCFDTFTLGSRREISRYPGDWITPLYSIYADSGSPLIGDLSEKTAVEFAKDGRPIWPRPGSEGYKRVSIYTFVR